MGWGAPPDQKRVAMGKSRMLVSEMHSVGASAVVIDVTAVFRHKFAHANKSRSTPRQFVGQFIKSITSMYGPSVRHYIFCIDVPGTMPPAREKFYRTRRYASSTETPKRFKACKLTASMSPHESLKETGNQEIHLEPEVPQVETHAITPDHVPVDWATIWSQPKAKAAAWRIIQILLTDYAETTRDCKTITIDGPCGAVRIVAGVKTAITQERWGEADVRCFRWARAIDTIDEIIVIDTIDFDMLLQVSIHPFAAKTILRLGTSFDVDGIYSAKAAAKVKAQRMHELVDVNLFTSTPQASKMHRLFVMLAMGGVDYCRGLVRFGANHAELSRHLGRDAGFISVDVDEVPDHETGQESELTCLRRVLRFNTARFLRWFRGVKHKKSQMTGDELVEELASMIFCVAYFLGFDVGGTVCGPDESNISESVHASCKLLKGIDLASAVHGKCNMVEIYDGPKV